MVSWQSPLTRLSLSLSASFRTSLLSSRLRNCAKPPELKEQNAIAKRGDNGAKESDAIGSTE